MCMCTYVFYGVREKGDKQHLRHAAFRLHFGYLLSYNIKRHDIHPKMYVLFVCLS